MKIGDEYFRKNASFVEKCNTRIAFGVTVTFWKQNVKSCFTTLYKIRVSENKKFLKNKLLIILC